MKGQLNMGIDTNALDKFLNGVKDKVGEPPTEPGDGAPPASKEVKGDGIKEEETENDNEPNEDAEPENKVAVKDNVETGVHDADDDGELEFEDDTSEKQSKDKNNKANKAFAEKSRENKKLKTEVANTKAELDGINTKFKNLAKEHGFVGIETADDYFNALADKQSKAKFQKTKDPDAIVEMTERRILKKMAPVLERTNKVVKTYGEEQFKSEWAEQMQTMNTKYGTNIKSSDDIAKLPNARQIIDRLKKGDSLADAYLLVNQDTILSDNARIERQKALNASKGYKHMSGNSNSGKVESNKLSEEDINNNLTLWKELYPGKTRGQYTKMMQKARDRGDL